LSRRHLKHSIPPRAPSRYRGRRRKRRDFGLLVVIFALACFVLTFNSALPGFLKRPLSPAAAHAAGRPASAAPGKIHEAAAESHPILAPRISYGTRWLDSQPARQLDVRAAAAILVDLDTKTVLWSRDSNSRRAPASLTKMMTAMVALDHASLDRPVTVPPEAAEMEPDVMGLSAGEVLSVDELLYGLFLNSGNDAAEALARGIVPRDQFLGEMNAKAARLQLKNSHFSNPSGLDDPDLFSSAYDLAVVAGYLEKNYPALAKVASTREQPIPATSTHKAFDPWSLNKMLWIYPGATGLKTGLTDDAGGCVAVTVTRDNRHLLAVVLHSDVFFTDASRLLDFGFSVRTP
jgi:D-alanyl-D-alanine carboxypeptidase (penicillin-binding protein 5/6)